MRKLTLASTVESALYDTRINDRTKIRIIDNSDKSFITYGAWYQDNILDFFDSPVIAEEWDYEENELTLYI